MPAALVTAPVLSTLGAKRPELILGFPLFLAGGVRIDYAAQTLTFARDAAQLRDRDAFFVPIELMGSMFTTSASVNGALGTFAIDTGSGPGFSLDEDWAAGSSGLPGSYPFYESSRR